ncbi:hypothetical protein ACS127_11855 [Amphibacillus sp. Q70]|uniref:hypothetical protein n=1 Tax=Amphibacillus sp. Q70 TaxID=3453416 RepID=UPI003F85F188
MRDRKTLWIILLLIDSALLIYSFISKSWWLSVLSLVIVLVIKHFSYDLLFKKFDEAWDKRHEELKSRREQFSK